MATQFPIWFDFGHTIARNKITSFSHFSGTHLNQKSRVPTWLMGAELAHFDCSVQGVIFRKTTQVEATWLTKDQQFKIGFIWDPSSWLIAAEWYGKELVKLAFPAELPFHEVLQNIGTTFAKALTKNPAQLSLLYIPPQPNEIINMDDFGVELLIPLEARQIPEAYKAFKTLPSLLNTGWIRGDVVLTQCQRHFQRFEDAMAAYRHNDTGVMSPELPQREGDTGGLLKSYVYVLHLRVPFTIVPQVWKAFEALHQDTAPTLGPALHCIAPAFLTTHGSRFVLRKLGITFDWAPLYPTLRDDLALGEPEPKVALALDDAFAQLDMATMFQDVLLQSMGLADDEDEEEEEEDSEVVDAIENDSDSVTEDTAHQETNATSHHDTPDSPSVSKHPTPCGIPMNDILEAINACDELFAEWENDAIIVTHTLTQPAYQTVIAVREPTFEDLLADELQAVITVTTATDKALEAIDAETLNRYAVGSAYSSPGIGARCFGSRFTVPKSALEENGGAVWRDVLIPLMVGATRYALAPLIALLTNPGALKHDSEEDTSTTWTERDFNRLRDTWSMIFTLCTTGETGLTGEFELIDGNTALWQIRKETHPVAGPGLVITLTLPKHYETESACADQADLLNELEMIIGTPAPHFGAWTEKRRFLTYVCFLPNTMYRCQSLFINLPIYAMVRARWAYIESRRLDWVE